MVQCVEGVPCWADAMLPDVAAGRRFYGELFGWTFAEGGAGYRPYTWARLGGEDVAALVPKSDGRMPTVWNVYLATEDAAAATARIREAGGRVIVAPRWIDDLGVMATAADPGGAVFGLWQTGTHPGFARRGVPGSYGWTEVHTREPRVVDAFYRTVFGYEARPVRGRAPAPDTGEEAGPAGPAESAEPGPKRPAGPAGPGPKRPADVLLWSPRGEPAGPGHAVAGRVVLGEPHPAELPAHFLTYFVVADCDHASRTAQRLGGRVLNEPEDTPYGRFAVLADNQGAHFAVIDTSQGTEGARENRAGRG
ncbi:VOC family protein [Streptomyces sp. NPDC007983]|uniref:VOC family protein n=1 Tax=Streptomyces sp. NPDC007983 TaxID=3364800 RepID=UPI0036ECE8FA